MCLSIQSFRKQNKTKKQLLCVTSSSPQTHTQMMRQWDSTSLWLLLTSLEPCFVSMRSIVYLLLQLEAFWFLCDSLWNSFSLFFTFVLLMLFSKGQTIFVSSSELRVHASCVERIWFWQLLQVTERNKVCQRTNNLLEIQIKK